MPVLLHIDELAAGGDGVARHEGRAVFVPGAFPGDTVSAELAQERGAWRAREVRVVTPSADRVEPGCPHFETCGGCPWLELGLPGQEAAKERIFYGALERIGGIARDSLAARPIIASGQPLRYRTRATFHVESSRLGYSQRASHELVEIGECRLLDPRLEAALRRVREAIATEGSVPRCTDVSLACDERRVSAAFRVTSASRAAAERVERILRRARLDGAVLVAEGEPVRSFGKPVLSFPAPHAPGVTLHGRPDLFAQANAAANQRLVEEAVTALGTPATVLELFCGAGNFTFAIAARGARVTAVEIAGDSLELGRRSAREAHIESARFIAGDSLKIADALAREGQRFDALFLDPPRTGARGIGPIAARTGARRVVYVSCDPATLARDARELVANGFRPTAAVPVDMFPQTFHIEGVLVLERD